MELSEIRDLSKTMKDSTSRWAKSYVNDNRPEADSRYNEELKNLLTPAEKKILKRGPLCETVRSLMNKTPNASDHSFNRDFLCLRNYVVSNIFTRNAHIPGVVYNITLAEFESKRNIRDKYLIDVRKHKTAKHKGVADATIDSKFYNIMKMYSHFRQVLLDSKGLETPEFGITRDGTPLDSSSVNSSIQAVLRANIILLSVSGVGRLCLSSLCALFSCS